MVGWSVMARLFFLQPFLVANMPRVTVPHSAPPRPDGDPMCDTRPQQCLEIWIFCFLILNLEFWNLALGCFWEFGLLILEFWNLDFGFWVVDFGIGILEFGFWDL